MARVVVGLSGGVDSAVAALLLKRAGHDVVGVTLRTWEETENRCCEIEDARAIAQAIGIPFHVFNCVSAFERCVVQPFVRAYVEGLTPNPCVICNRLVKWEWMLYYAKVLGAEWVATGHYAHVCRLDNGRYTVRRAAHAEKDQTYMLYRLSQEQLAATLMPLADLGKEEVRRLAQEAGLPVAEKPDSQEICFVPDGHYADFIAARAPDAPGEGAFVDAAGRVLGTHRGITRYTVGQRKGLGIALGRPAYVTRLCAARNEVVLGTEEDLLTDAVTCTDVNWLSVPGLAPGERLPARVKIRYHHEAQDAVLTADGDNVRVTFSQPVKAAAPGQSAVFYDAQDCVIGGGILTDPTQTGGKSDDRSL